MERKRLSSESRDKEKSKDLLVVLCGGVFLKSFFSLAHACE